MERKLFQSEQIKSVAIATKTFGEAVIAGKMYGFLSNWRGHRVRYIGENGVIYSTERKQDFKRLPRKQKYVDQILQIINKDVPKQLKLNI